MNMMRISLLGLILIIAVSMIFLSCARETANESGNPLAGTAWRLVEIQSMDDAIGVVRPNDPSDYTMHLSDDSTVTMRLNCNRAKGTWLINAGDEGKGGSIEFGPLAMTLALCPPPSLDERIARDFEYIRTYLLKDGRLFLSLMADGGIYVWEPDTVKASAYLIPAAPEDGDSATGKSRESHRK